MQVYTVVTGDELRLIAEEFGTTPRELMRLNELPNQEVLVPGLHLLVPGPPTLAQPHTVQAGETLAAIARRYGLPQAQLERYTGYRETAGRLPQSGETLLVPRRIERKRAIEVNGYMVPTGATSDANILQDVGRALTFLSVFSYQARADGSLTPPRDSVALQAANRQQVAPLMTVTNFDGNTFNTELAHTLLANGSIRRRLLDNILRTARSRGYRGVNLDFEHMRPGDRPLYNQFVREVGQAVRAAGMTVSIAMGPKTADLPQQAWMGAFDYRTLGQEVDFLMLMTYEWGWVGGPPQAVAPLDQVRAVLDYATSVIPPNKILMGMSLYGYDWPLPFPTAGRASGIANNSAQNLAIQE
ncbi:MAG: LysM peptidoglycan-binding domain-containing protein, partial [Alicyclobacillus sp.]|nr:LysM peptidoglycan-binding domain-containing protein [Alicyclobacillus sp.]